MTAVYGRVVNGRVVEARMTPRHSLKGFAPKVAELAGQGKFDGEIADELGLTKAQVQGIRARHHIGAANGPGRGPVRVPVRAPLPLLDLPSGSPANARWCALLAAADERAWLGMRRAVCKALRVPSRISDETMIVAAQQDPRTPDELADAYLLALGEVPCPS